MMTKINVSNACLNTTMVVTVSEQNAPMHTLEAKISLCEWHVCKQSEGVRDPF